MFWRDFIASEWLSKIKSVKTLEIFETFTKFVNKTFPLGYPIGKALIIYMEGYYE